MTPAIALSVIFGSFYSAIYHLWQGRTLKALAFYLAAGIIGFLAGQAIAAGLHLQFYTIGTTHIIEATVASWLALFLTRWLQGN